MMMRTAVSNSVFKILPQTKIKRLPKLMSEDDLDFGNTRFIIFTLKDEIGGLAKALKLFQVRKTQIIYCQRKRATLQL